MRFFLIIIGFILSCNFSDRISFDEKVCCEIMQDTGNRNLDSDSCAILPSCATGYIGGNGSVTFSHRSPNSGRRIQPNAKFSFLVVKDGRIFNRNSLYSFQTGLKQFHFCDVAAEFVRLGQHRKRILLERLDLMGQGQKSRE